MASGRVPRSDLNAAVKILATVQARPRLSSAVGDNKLGSL
jgi:hypothetical protein